MNIQQLSADIAAMLASNGFRVAKSDFERPWGGFFVLEENDAERFIETWFPGYEKADLMIGNKLSPKILMVAPGKRLSWQYHFRRAEIWRVVQGPVKVTTSDTDEEQHENILKACDIIRLKQGERHRLIGMDHWGVIAEIWQHTTPAHPSDEEDIVRLQDDFGR